MKILALETGSLVTVVAAVDTAAATPVLALETLAEHRALARDLIVTVDQVLRQANWSLEEVELIATGTGPGSWTSLRVGLTTAKTLAQVNSKSLIGIPTFDVLAAAVAQDQPDAILLTVAPCRPGELYGKLFQLSKREVQPLSQELIASPAAFTVQAHAAANDSGLALFVAGDAAANLSADPFVLLNLSPESIALALATTAAAKADSGQTDEPLGLVPLYLAPSSAERNLQAKTSAP